MNSEFKNFKPELILILMLVFISTWHVSNQVIRPHIDKRIQLVDNILSGRADPPYQYRVLKPLMARAFQSLISPLIDSPRMQHALSFSAILFISFICIYFLFYSYLRLLFSKKAAMIGIVLLQAAIPLTVTGYYMEGDFITLGFYLAGFNLMFHRKDTYLPIIVGLGALNREQIIFLMIFYIIYLQQQRRLTDKRSIYLIIACIASFILVLSSIHFYFGFKPSQYLIYWHVADNINSGRLFFHIIPLWLAGVAGFVILSVIAFNRSNTFFRLSFLSLGIYTLLFFIKGNLWELAKFLPAFLIIIPMSLQILTGEFVDEKIDRINRRSSAPGG